MALRGAKEMKAGLKAIRSGSQNAMRTATHAGAIHLREAEKRAVPRATGAGAKTIYAKRHRGRPGESRSTVEVSRRGFYLKILEVGAKAHRITPKGQRASLLNRRTGQVLATGRRTRALAIGKGRGSGRGFIVFRSAAQIPPLSARPWFAPTFRRERPNILAKIRESYAENLAKQAQKKGL